MSETILVAMRLADMKRVHPQQIESEVCSQCGERVGIYPSGQQAMREYPDLKILCYVCRPPDADKIGEPAARSLDGFLREIAESTERNK